MKSFSFSFSGAVVRLRINQCTSVNIGRCLKIDSTAIYLKGSCSDVLEFPDNDGKFNLAEYPDRTSFIIYNGTDSSRSDSSAMDYSQQPSTSSSTLLGSSSFSNKRALVTVKVVRADLVNKKLQNIHSHNLTVHIPIWSEADANVEYITLKVGEEMNDGSLVIVGSSGLCIYDQEGTRGLAFWKVGSRKVYAVPSNDVNSHKHVLEDSSESFQMSSKRARYSSSYDDPLEHAITNLVHEVADVKDEMEKFHKLAFKHKFSLSLLNALESAFECSICKRTPSRSPLIACSACSTLVGCERCTNRWYSGATGLEKSCPKCRTERGLTKTFVLKGFDSLTSQIRLMTSNGNSSSSEESANDDYELPAAPL